MTDGRLGIAGRSWEQLQPLLFLGNQMDEMRNSQPCCPGNSKCLCLAVVICQGREFVILTGINSEMMNLDLLFFSHKKKGVRGKERESEQILICLRCKIYGFGLYASHNRMLWGFYPKYFPWLACLGWLHPNDQILSEVRTASRLLCKL